MKTSLKKLVLVLMVATAFLQACGKSDSGSSANPIPTPTQPGPSLPGYGSIVINSTCLAVLNEGSFQSGSTYPGFPFVHINSGYFANYYGIASYIPTLSSSGACTLPVNVVAGQHVVLSGYAIWGTISHHSSWTDPYDCDASAIKARVFINDGVQSYELTNTDGTPNTGVTIQNTGTLILGFDTSAPSGMNCVEAHSLHMDWN